MLVGAKAVACGVAERLACLDGPDIFDDLEGIATRWFYTFMGLSPWGFI